VFSTGSLGTDEAAGCLAVVGAVGGDGGDVGGVCGGGVGYAEAHSEIYYEGVGVVDEDVFEG